jgi:hypothetical protein
MDDDLIEHIQDLPPELFNMIKSNVLHYSLPELSPDGFRYEHIAAAYKYPLHYMWISDLVRNSRNAIMAASSWSSRPRSFSPNSSALWKTSTTSKCEACVCLQFHNFFSPSGAHFKKLKVRLEKLTRMGEMVGCIGNENRVLAVPRKMCTLVSASRQHDIIETATSRMSGKVVAE